jgi:hypothetical protein
MKRIELAELEQSGFQLRKSPAVCSSTTWAQITRLQVVGGEAVLTDGIDVGGSRAWPMQLQN